MLKDVYDILLALDSGNLALLSLLDTVDHDTLLRRLQTSYGLDGVVIKWFASCSRTQHVRTPTTTSLPSPVRRVRNPSRIGPRTDPFSAVYVADLLKLIKRHQLSPHAYADDTQIYGFCQPSDVNALTDSVRLLR